jgi:predicted enzyme related to lactoylglutathione lyase
MKNAANWFEIPVRDMDRALACYETLLAAPLRRETFGARPYAIFPHEPPGAGGALVQDPAREPGAGGPKARPHQTGTLVYLNVDGQLDAVLSRAAAAKAVVILPKTSIGNDGHIAILADTEGNRVGLNSFS